MKRSINRILTTHTGSLVRPPELLAFARARQKREPVDDKAFETTLRNAVHDVVARQVDAGIECAAGSHKSGNPITPLEPAHNRGRGPFARPNDDSIHVLAGDVSALGGSHDLGHMRRCGRCRSGGS